MCANSNHRRGTKKTHEDKCGLLAIQYEEVFELLRSVANQIATHKRLPAWGALLWVYFLYVFVFGVGLLWIVFFNLLSSYWGSTRLAPLSLYHRFVRFRFLYWALVRVQTLLKPESNLRRETETGTKKRCTREIRTCFSPNGNKKYLPCAMETKETISEHKVKNILTRERISCFEHEHLWRTSLCCQSRRLTKQYTCFGGQMEGEALSSAVTMQGRVGKNLLCPYSTDLRFLMTLHWWASHAWTFNP